MSQKTLGIKLEVDTSQLSKITVVTDKLEESLKKTVPITAQLLKLDFDRSVAVARISTEYSKLQALVDKTNAAVASGAQIGVLAAANMERASAATNKRLQEQLDLVGKINTAEAHLKFSSGVSKSAPAISEATGASEARQTALRAISTARIVEEDRTAKAIKFIQENLATSSLAIERQHNVQLRTVLEQRKALYSNVASSMSSGSSIPTQASAIRGNISSGISSSGAIAANLSQEVTARNSVSSAIARQTEQLHKYNQVLRNSAIEHKSLLRHVGEIILSYRVLNSVINTTKQAFLNIVPAGFEQQATQAALTGIFGSQQAADNLKFVAETANTAGVSLTALEQSYRRFAPSAVLAGASLDKTNQSFKDFAEVSAILHLSEDKVNSVFLALDQMFAKGVVQSEEIKKQLGNVLPAAVEIGAQAIGKTPAQFMEAMKKNEVIAKDFVPKFSELYRKIFGGAGDEVFKTVEERLFANTQRIKNQYEIFNRGLYAELQGTLNNFASATVGSLTTINENLTGIIQALGALSILTLARVVELTIAASIGAKANRVYAASFTELSFAQGRFAAVSSIAAGQAVAASGVAVQGAATSSAALFGVSRIFAAASAALTSPLAVITATVTAVTGLTLALSGASIEYSKFIGASKTEIANLKATYDAQGAGAKEAGERLQELTRLQEKSNSFFIVYQGTQIQLGSVVQSVWNNIKRSIGAVLTFIKNVAVENFTAIGVILTGIVDVIKSSVVIAATLIYDLISGTIAAIKGLGAIARSVLDDIKARNFTGMLDRASTAFEDSSRKTTKVVGDLYGSLGSKITTVGDTIANKAVAPFKGIGDSILNNAKLIQDAENKKKLSENPTVPGTPPATGLDDNSLENLSGKGRKDLYKDLARDSKLATEAMQADLKQLDFSYHENLISINAYFERKKQLQIGDIEQQLLAADDAKRIAGEAKDSAKVEQYTDEIQNLMRKAQDVQTDIDNEKYKALEQYNQKLQEVQANALEATGNLDAANVIRINIKYLQDEKLLKQNGTLEQQKQLAISKQYEVSKGILATYDAKANAALAVLNAQEISINIARENGLLNQQQATDKLIEVKLKILEIDKETVRQLEIQVATNQGNLELVNQLNAAKAKVQQDYSGSGAAQRINQEGISDFAATYNTNKAQLTSDKVLSDAKASDDIQANLKEQMLATNEADMQSALEQHQQLLDNKAAADQNYDNATRKNNLSLYGGMAGVASTTFEGMTSSMIKMYGAQSKQAKAAFLAYKAFAIAQTIISTAQAVMAQLSNPTPYVGIALAALAAAMGAIQVANIIAQPMPQAHAGLTSVPENNQTYVLSKGERVLAPQQNQDLTRALKDGTMNNQQTQPQNIRIINAVDPELFSEWATSSEGERVIMNTVRRNQAA